MELDPLKYLKNYLWLSSPSFFKVPREWKEIFNLWKGYPQPFMKMYIAKIIIKTNNATK